MLQSIRQTLLDAVTATTQLPWLILLAIAIPLVAVAYRWKTYPSMRWLILLGVSTVLSLVTIAVPNFLLLTVIVDTVLIVLVFADLLWLRTLGDSGITATRIIPRTCSLGVAFKTQLTLENRSRLTLRGRFRDDTPEGFGESDNSQKLNLRSGDRVTLTRSVKPNRRGAFQFERVDLQYASPLRFWVRHQTLPLIDKVNVYPDMKQLADYALLARTNRLSQIGVRRTRKIGQDSEFERLRDYTRDDNYRHIDWRSTARRSKLTVRQFQTDQSQRIIFLLDCGRMMTNHRDEYSLLDHALNSILMMSYVALSQGDAVGMLCFSDQIHAFVPPRGGASHMNRLIQAGFDQFPRLVESRYDQAFLHVSQHCKRRSLIVLATNLIDEVNAHTVKDYLGNLSGSHLPLAILLRDRDIFDAADAGDQLVSTDGSLRSPTVADQHLLYRSAVASEILLWRKQVINDLRHRGALVIDEFPDQLTAPLINEYLRVKAKHLL